MLWFQGQLTISGKDDDGKVATKPALKDQPKPQLKDRRLSTTNTVFSNGENYRMWSDRKVRKPPRFL